MFNQIVGSFLCTEKALFNWSTGPNDDARRHLVESYVLPVNSGVDGCLFVEEFIKEHFELLSDNPRNMIAYAAQNRYTVNIF